MVTLHVDSYGTRTEAVVMRKIHWNVGTALCLFLPLYPFGCLAWICASLRVWLLAALHGTDDYKRFVVSENMKWDPLSPLSRGVRSGLQGIKMSMRLRSVVFFWILTPCQKLHSWEQIKFAKYSLPFNLESSVFPSALLYKLKYENLQNHNFTYCFVWMWKLGLLQ